MRTPLGVGSLVLLHDQARPKSSEPYKLPALSTTAIDEPFAAMQPVSAIPSIHSPIDSPPGRKVICRRGDKNVIARERYRRAVRCV